MKKTQVYRIVSMYKSKQFKQCAPGIGMNRIIHLAMLPCTMPSYSNRNEYFRALSTNKKDAQILPILLSKINYFKLIYVFSKFMILRLELEGYLSYNVSKIFLLFG